ncbi:MAG: F0F1 ATP synthase subunit epsilon [Tateyamaria sp.]|nr:F0F1 ATP synthase subunit epsilon [Tateyamaria sp.]
MQFELVSPERSLASLVAVSVEIPGADGDMTIMADHAPTITTLRPGLLKVEDGASTHEYIVTGGFAEIGVQGVSVLAEQAVIKSDMTQEKMDAMVGEAQEFLDCAKESSNQTTSQMDDAAKLLADMIAVGVEIGMTIK